MRKALLTIAAASVALLLTAAPAGAQNPYEGVTAGLSAVPANPAPGGDVVISGDGCEAGAEVSMTIDGAPAGATTAADDGAFSATISAPDAAGQYLVNAVCGDVVLGVVLNVGDALEPLTPVDDGAAPAAPVTGPTGGAPLALTGTSTVWLASLGLSLLAIGGFVLMVLRGRTRAADAR